jgi:hypothetical protein
MEKAQYRCGASLADTRSYLDMHPEVFRVVMDSPARHQLDAALEDLAARSLAQSTAVRLAAGLTERRAQLSAELKGAFLKPIAQFARKSVRGEPGFAAVTRSNHRKHGSALVAAAQATAVTAAPLAGAFTAAGFPPDFLEQLRACADALEATLDAQLSTKSERVSATEGIALALASGREAIGLLDPVVSRLLRSSELLAGWQLVKRVRRSTAAHSG